MDASLRNQYLGFAIGQVRAASLKSRKREKFASVAEEKHEQDLSGFLKTNVPSLHGTDEVAGCQDAVDKAMDAEACLHRLVNVLAESPLSNGVRQHAINEYVP